MIEIDATLTFVGIVLWLIVMAFAGGRLYQLQLHMKDLRELAAVQPVELEAGDVPILEASQGHLRAEDVEKIRQQFAEWANSDHPLPLVIDGLKVVGVRRGARMQVLPGTTDFTEIVQKMAEAGGRP